MEINCSETNRTKVVSVIAYQPSDVVFNSLAAQHKKMITRDDFTLPSPQNGVKLSLERNSCKVTEKTSANTLPTVREVALSFKWKLRSEDDASILDDLSRNNKCFIVNTINSQSYLIITTDTGYSFTYSEDEGEIECEMKSVSAVGLMRIL